MVKNSLGTKSKEKYIYVSSDRHFLCWKSLDKDDKKRIELRKVNTVLRGKEETVFYVQSNHFCQIKFHINLSPKIHMFENNRNRRET
jgi:hypothetical protein